MRSHLSLFGVAGLIIACSVESEAQQAPSIGYMFPPGGKAGSTIDVVLGGYDWTPDMELFVRDERIQLELTGKPGPVIVPEPPYWFGKKARRPPFLMPRETPARLTLPADLKPGVYRWQVANANGASVSGKFSVSDGREVIEIGKYEGRQSVGPLPVTVSGQILKIEEVDEYEFTATNTGPITCSLVASSIGSPLTAIVEVRDRTGRLITDAADTAARDVQFTFDVKAKETYVVRLFDADFRGNRSFVYRLSLAPGLPKPSTVPNTDLPELSVADAQQAGSVSVPSAVFGILSERYDSERFQFVGTKGQTIEIEAEAERIGSPIDVSLTVVDGEGKELKHVDDVSGTTDARLEFTVPADGDYGVIVSDTSGSSGNEQAVYRLSLREAQPGFLLKVPEILAVPINGSTVLSITAERRGGYAGPISISIDGLPEGVTIPDDSAIPAKKTALKLKVAAADNMGTMARFVSVKGSAVVEDSDDEQKLESKTEPLLCAVTMTPPFTVDAEGKDDVTKWPRGTTFPAPVLIEREESFDGDIVLEMAAKQGRHRQGIRGPEMVIRPEDTRIFYPVTLPEWLETTRTSRIVVNGVAQVADPRGRVRYLSTRLKTRIGFLPTGAMLKIECPLAELEFDPGAGFEFPINVFRSSELRGPIQIQLVDSPECFSAEAVSLEERSKGAALQIRCNSTERLSKAVLLKARATASWNGHPVVARTSLLVAPRDEPSRKVARTPVR